jgi:ATP-dependent protease HslVU (ClpYQ) peptidase subunit
MTCIVGLVRDGKVYMGGDAAISSSDSWLQPQSMRPKIWNTRYMIIGVGGKQRIAQLIQQFPAPAYTRPASMDGFDYLLYEYIPHLIEYLDAARVIKTNDEDGMVCMDATVLIGLRGRLFKIDSGFAITEYPDYAAIGANAEVALGALYSSGRQDKLHPPGRIGEALDAVLHHCASVREPFTILEI